MSPAPKVLIVEDEESFLDALRVALSREGFAIDVARDGSEALERFEAGKPDLVLLDVMLPRLSGIDVCREIRTKSQVPIIMVTAKAEEIDAVVGLEVGADDYVAKPYRLRELVARIRALLRRSSFTADSIEPPAPEIPSRIEVGDVVVDIESHEVMVRDDRVDLPLKEFDLLVMLTSHAGRVVTRDRLIEEVWGSDYVGDTKTLDVHIKRLRSKVEVEPSNPERIVTIRGLGYKYEPVS